MPVPPPPTSTAFPETRNRFERPAHLAVATEHRASGQTQAENLVVYEMELPAPLTPGVPNATVGLKHSDSICRNYCTTKVEVMVSVPCDFTEAAMNTAREFASLKVQEYLEQEKSIVGGQFEGYQMRPVRLAGQVPDAPEVEDPQQYQAVPSIAPPPQRSPRQGVPTPPPLPPPPAQRVPGPPAGGILRQL